MSETTRETRSGRPLDPARSQAILEAALTTLAESGYRGTTMAKVATRAGVSTATLYRRWRSRPELFLDALALARRRVADPAAEGPVGEESDADPRPPTPDTGDVVADMEILVDRLIAIYNSPDGMLFYGLIEEMREHPEMRPVVREQFFDPPRRATEAALRRGVARGQLAEIPDLPLVAEACYGLVHIRGLLTGETLDRDFARRAVRAILHPYVLAPQ